MRAYVVSWEEATKFDVDYISYSLNVANFRNKRLRIEVEENEGEDQVLALWLEQLVPHLTFEGLRLPVKEIDLTVMAVSFSGFTISVQSLERAFPLYMLALVFKGMRT